MSAADLAHLRALAHLARLELSEAELLEFAPELARILAAFEVLARHTPAACAAAPARAAPGRVRADEPQPSLARERLLASAPASADGFFVVPKTVGGPA